MADPILRVENIGKRYRVGQMEPYRTVREAFTVVLRRPHASKAAGGAESAGSGEAQGYLWALRNVSFELGRGEVLGIIGPNGAGKTTLLKILSRITVPTEGRAEIRGRVGSLLEVGAGFHPELTGRENIFLNGAVLGMKKSEIVSKFDEIVKFAELEKFMNTPVKRYSSGMYVRLAFSVAAHLEPEILVADEVLAVGDAAFQKKCLGKMGDVAREGRTVLFVSHNMGVINRLCPRTILLTDGKVIRDGPTPEVISEYLKSESASGGQRNWDDPSSAPGNERIRLKSIRVVSEGSLSAEVDIDKPASVEVMFYNHAEGIKNLFVNIYLLDSGGGVVLSTASTPAANEIKEDWYEKPHPKGLYRATCTLPANFLNEGRYFVSAFVVTLGPLQVEARAEQALSFEVFDTGVMREPGGGTGWPGAVRPRLPWTTELVGPPGAQG
jgi:lipopolysaccharide transport system ATP-binding protein